MQKILDKIKEYNKIIIFRHFRPDGDAIGSTKGLYTILKLTYPEKQIYLQNDDFSSYLSFLGGEDAPLPDEDYADALGIVVDTGTSKRISNKRYSLCRETVKIDHHIPLESYANYEWVEEHRSSSCEMIAKFYDTFKDELKINSEAATYIYAGMVTDSGRFRYREVSGETMRLAGMLLDVGIDTDRLYANLYMKDLDDFRFESYVHQHMKITEGGVAYIHITSKLQKKLGISLETASSCVSYMDSIKGSIIWVAFIDSPDGNIRVRLRSRFVQISDIGERYRGGGHACAAGATLEDKKEIKMILSELEERITKYKQENEGWL